MKKRVLLIPSVIAALIFALPAMAAKPNLTPGLWETTSTTSFEGPMEIPEESDTATECITEEDLQDADSFLLEDDDDCSYSDQEISSDRMTGTMQCQYDEETTATMEITLNFRGETSDGTLTGTLQTPMGELRVHTEMEGRRIDDC